MMSCAKKQDEQIMCTMEFKTVGITIMGDSLNDFYTIRLKNNDTLRINSYTPYANFYPVLDDSYSSSLKNSKEFFLFNGIIGDSVIVSEIFEISADDCHIHKVSGSSEIEI